MIKKKKEKAQEMQEDDYFDDCPVCQAMKKAQEEKRSPTMSEMKQAFKKAKEQGAVTGGPLVNDDNSN
ncbi:hypothetical protein C4577_00180 [Candidatus Parcubacteria bacterium]|nr:MAG: hypothetical protein C4577_00180 [Candidatus Parcubacteria bacterium]